MAAVYRKRRKFRGIINFVVFADATIPRNLILGRQFTQLYWYSYIDYNAVMQNVVLIEFLRRRVRSFALHEPSQRV